MKKCSVTVKISLLLAAVLPVAGCKTVDYSAPLAGLYVTAAYAVKDFEVVGPVYVSSTETHKAGPFGLVKTVSGSKVTYSDLILEAALIDADDIIDVRIDINSGKKAKFARRLSGWERVFSYTGKALAIRYISSKDNENINVGFFHR